MGIRRKRRTPSLASSKKDPNRWVFEAIEKPLRLDDKIRWSCNLSGSCCYGTPVLINPHDVWRMVHEPKMKERFGIELTTHLFGFEGAPLDLYLGPTSKMPLASIIHRPLEGGRKLCPFARPEFTRYGDELRPRLTVDQKPMVPCGAHEGRPTICRGFPLGRAMAGDETGAIVGEDVFVSVQDNCDNCFAGNRDGPEITVREWLEACGAMEGYRLSRIWLTEIANLMLPLSEKLRWMVGLFAYDFDRPHATSVELAKKHRPKDFPEHMARIRKLVDALVAQDMPATVEALKLFGIDVSNPIMGDLTTTT